MGDGLAVALGEGEAVAVGSGVSVGSGVAVGTGVGSGVGAGVVVGSGVAVALGSGVAVGSGETRASAGVSAGSGDGVGTSVGSGGAVSSGGAVGAGVALGTCVGAAVGRIVGETTTGAGVNEVPELGTTVGAALRPGSVGANVGVATGGTVARAVSGGEGGRGNMKDEAANTKAAPINATARTVATSVPVVRIAPRNTWRGSPEYQGRRSTRSRRSASATEMIRASKSADACGSGRRPEELDESRRSAEFGGAAGAVTNVLGQPTGVGLVELVEQERVDQPAGGMIGLRATHGAHT